MHVLTLIYYYWIRTCLLHNYVHDCACTWIRK